MSKSYTTLAVITAIAISAVVATTVGCNNSIPPATEDLDLDAILASSTVDKLELSADYRFYGYLSEDECSGDRFVSTVVQGGERTITWLMPRLKRSVIKLAREKDFLLKADEKPDLKFDNILLCFSLTFQRGPDIVLVEVTATDDDLPSHKQGNDIYNIKVTVQLVQA